MKNSKKNWYLSSWEKAIHETNIRLTIEQEKAVLKAFNDAGTSLIEKIKKSRKGYLPIRIYKDYAYDLHAVLVQLMTEYSHKAAMNAVDGQVVHILKMLAEDGNATAENFKKEVRAASLVYSRRAAEAVVKGEIYKDGKNLSKRVWSSAARAGNDVQQIVTQGLASGMSAVDMAKLLEQYIDPKARKEWDFEKVAEKLGKTTARKYENLEYNALRLARTTISHSATAGVRQWGKVNPYARKVQWHSVHAPGRTCQACRDLDGEVFPIEECPFDHPNGMCYQTVWYDQTLDEIADELRRWVDGEENETLDTWFNDLSSGKTEKYSDLDFVKSY
nr:MAG TPA: minor capsid protein [Caudoviricetes sp.]